MIPMPKRNTVEDAAAIGASARVRSVLAQTDGLASLGELGRVAGGSTPATTDPSNWGGDIVWVTPKDLGRPRNVEVCRSERTITEEAWPNFSDRLLPIGTVLFSCRAPIGHVGIAGIQLCTNQGFKNVVCSQDLEPRFLFHMLRGAIPEIEAQGRGNAFHEIGAKVIKRLPVPVPSLERQAAVAAALDSFYLRLAGPSTDGRASSGELADLEGELRFIELAEQVVALHRLHAAVGERLGDLLPALLSSADSWRPASRG
jgi:hypothetical protein